MNLYGAFECAFHMFACTTTQPTFPYNYVLVNQGFWQHIMCWQFFTFLASLKLSAIVM